MNNTYNIDTTVKCPKCGEKGLDLAWLNKHWEIHSQKYQTSIEQTESALPETILPEIIPNNVIYVDFIAKKRVA